MKKTNATYKYLENRLKGYGKLNRIDGNKAEYEDGNVRLIFDIMTPSHSLIEAKGVWYANGYQCFKFTDLTEDGCNNYFKMLGL